MKDKLDDVIVGLVILLVIMLALDSAFTPYWVELSYHMAGLGK